MLASFETAGRTVTLVRGDVGRYAVVVERSEYAGGPANMSNDRAYACLAAATVGPDDFNVQLEGPALVPVVEVPVAVPVVLVPVVDCNVMAPLDARVGLPEPEREKEISSDTPKAR